MVIGVVSFHHDHYHDHTTKQTGGCEDPRVVEDEEGTYWLMYTAFDGHVARLSVG
jgi:predicted GH43/DUF377 family glycosyl hydrolase